MRERGWRQLGVTGPEPSQTGEGNHTAPTSRYWISMENMPLALRHKGCFSCQAPVNETSNRYNSASPLKSSSCGA